MLPRLQDEIVAVGDVGVFEQLNQLVAFDRTGRQNVDLMQFGVVDEADQQFANEFDGQNCADSTHRASHQLHIPQKVEKAVFVERDRLQGELLLFQNPAVGV